jgi:hypothetical protein
MKKILFLIFLMALASCDPIKTEYDPKADFTQYKTFCWLQGCEFTFTGPAYLDDSLVQETVKEAIIAEMKFKGLDYNNNTPDLLIDFHITIENEKVIYYHGIEDEPTYYHTPFLQPESITLTKGSLLIHMVDRQRSEVVWQSQAEGYMESPPDLSPKNIRRGIGKVLRDYPPQK